MNAQLNSIWQVLASRKIHIYEENTQILWGVLVIVCLAMATWLLANAFMSGSWRGAGYTQLGSLLLFTISFYGIIRITTPLLHFILAVSGNILTIETWREGSRPMNVQKIDLLSVAELRIAPHTARGQNEAFFDFSPDYHLFYRNRDEAHFRNLIDLEAESFTLKVEDLREIISFIRSHNPDIHIPDDPHLFLEVR